MKILNATEAIKKVQTYLNFPQQRPPFFVIADDSDAYKNLKSKFSYLLQIKVSDFCKGDYPADLDALTEKLQTLEQDALCLGLGEHALFTGQETTLLRFYEEFFPHKVIFLCRGVANFVEQMAEPNSKFSLYGVCRIAGSVNFRVEKYEPTIPLETDAQNFSEMLNLLESGDFDSLTVKSELPLLYVHEIQNSYEAIKFKKPHLKIAENALTPAQWNEYLQDQNCEGYPPEHWRTFADGFKKKISPEYLQYVFARSSNSQEYIQNIVLGILNCNDAEIFDTFYNQRKELVKNFPAPYISEYLAQLKKMPYDALKYLTDNTPEECRAMIENMQGASTVPPLLQKNYPALADWLGFYDFGNEKINVYFSRYKEIKLFNIDDENFKNLVQEFALKKPYTKFETRRAVLERIKKPAKLYWLDALGVEFLSYIKACAARLNLSVEIKIARAELPTLTSINKFFYEDWQDSKFEKNSALDELKHSAEKFDAGKCSAPTYIFDELKIIDDVLAEIKIALQTNDAEKVILTSDHGASRLAVMYGRESKYSMHTAGEHSGRCCPVNEIDEKPDNVVEENFYWVSANYDRFKGGRLSSVEVHGGATLEEILVPIIEISQEL